MNGTSWTGFQKLGPFGHILKIDALSEHQPIHTYQTSYEIPTQTKYNVTIEFYSSKSFADACALFNSVEEEQLLRQQNPTLNRAWEEYQLLLNLIKT